MIDNISGASATYGINLYEQNTQKKAGTSQEIKTSNNHIIEDKVDLSPKAKQTLEEYKKAQKAKQDKLTEEILSKGFRTWSEEYHKEKLEAEVRAQVLRSLGLTEDEYSKLDSKVQQRIEEIIQAKAREKMEEEMAKELEKVNNNPDAIV